MLGPEGALEIKCCAFILQVRKWRLGNRRWLGHGQAAGLEPCPCNLWLSLPLLAHLTVSTVFGLLCYMSCESISPISLIGNAHLVTTFQNLNHFSNKHP